MKDSRSCLLSWSFGLVVATVGFPQENEPDEALIDCEGDAATTQFCLDKEEAFELRARIEAVFPELKILTSPPWSAEDYLIAETNYNDGVKLYREQYYGDAITKFETALQTITQLQETFQSVAEEKQAAVSGYLAREEYETAVVELTTLIEWYPDDQNLIELLANATLGQSLRPVLHALQEHIFNSEFEIADQVLSAFPADYFKEEIASVRQALDTYYKDIEFNASMTAGHDNMRKSNWIQAKQNIENALRIRPQSTVAIHLLKIVQENHRLEQLADLTQEIQNAVASEQWEHALAKIQEIKVLDDRDETDLSNLENDLNALVKLDSELFKYGAMDFADLDGDQRTVIQDFLDNTEHLIKFDRTRLKRESLKERFAQYITPIEVKILSDNATTIRIRPGKVIGSFRSKTLEILPGSYEIIGTRRGFKQVIRSLEVKPNSGPLKITVKCLDRF